jgi:hypothetical protein
MEKTCTKCNETKSISEFNKQKTSKYGVTSICKVCKTELSKNWRLNNPDRHKESAKNWRENNPERSKEYSKESAKNWILNNPERHKKNVKKWQYKIAGVYGIYNDDILLYVGQSKQLNGRITYHKSYIKNPTKASVDVQLFYHTLNQYKSVYFNIIEECSPTVLLEREAHYITQLKPLLNKRKI